jgi:hypothetical protein
LELIKLAKKKTNEEFISEVKQKRGSEYVFQEPYQGTNVKIPVKHIPCGYVWDVKPNTFLNLETGCPKCSGKKHKTNKEFLKEIFDLVGNEYTFLDEYVNKSTHLRIVHNTCHHKYKVTPNHFLKGRRCPKCIRKGRPQYRTKTTEEFANDLRKLKGDEFIVVGDYTDNKTKIDIKHVKCGKIFKVRPNSILSKDTGCPRCKRSIGEERVNEAIIKYLSEDFTYRAQHTFKTCKLDKVLPFDFVIFKKNGKKAQPVLAIEYDGIQHFIPTFGKTEEEKIDNLVKTNKRDSVKDGWCMAKEINLIRIPYTKLDKIDSIIKKALTKL